MSCFVHLLSARVTQFFGKINIIGEISFNAIPHIGGTVFLFAFKTPFDRVPTSGRLRKRVGSLCLNKGSVNVYIPFDNKIIVLKIKRLSCLL